VIAGQAAGTDEDKPRADLNRPWRAIVKRAALTGLRIHDLRHTHASVGAGLGLGLPIIGKGVLERYVLEQISPSSLYMSPSAIAAIVLPGWRIGLRLWRHKRRWPFRGIGPIVGIAVDNLGLVGDLDAVFINPEGRRP
jgi:hypothetical protein